MAKRAGKQAKVAGVYARISLDRKDGEGVARQLADCKALATDRGWQVQEYVDNDVSAYRRKRRPEWDRLLDDLRDGQLGAVVAYHPDRLYRRLTDLESFVDAVGGTVEVATVKAGEVDLATASGRLMATMLAAMARHEAERMGERVSRAKLERARDGRPAGGGIRPFGLDPTRTTIIDEEATVVRTVAANILAGATMSSEAHRLNQEGLRTSGGSYWTTAAIRRTLTSPYVAGLRSYKGEIMGPATWPAILDTDTWSALEGAMRTRRMPGRPAGGRHLLTGLVVCGECGHRLYGNDNHGNTQYRCPPGQATNGKGCGRVAIGRDRLDRFVADRVTGWLSSPVILAEMDLFLSGGADVAGDLEEHVAVVARQADLAERWALGSISTTEFDTARPVLARRLEVVQARLQGGRRGPVRVRASEVAGTWADPDLTLVDRRGIIGDLAQPIVVARTVDGKVAPVGERVVLARKTHQG